MEGDAYLGELASGIIYLLAGTRLVLLGVRTGEAPERLLGGRGSAPPIPPGAAEGERRPLRAFGLQSNVSLVTLWADPDAE